MNRVNSTAFLSLILLLGCARVCCAASCPARVKFGEKIRRYSEKYENWSYGFATVIPKDLVGLDEDDPDYQRGFTILLPHDGGTIWVFGEANSGGYKNLRSAAEADMGYLKDRSERLVSHSFGQLQMGGLPAERFSAEFRCKGDTHLYAYASALTVSQSGEYSYEIIWEGRQVDAVSAKRTVHSLERSWKFLKPR